MVAPDKLTRGMVIDKELKAEIERRYNGWDDLCQQLAAALAKIDELMLEYCPEEMTNEQITEYEKHQRPAWRNFSLELKK